MTFRDLIDDYRRGIAEMLLGWAMNLYPVRTPDDEAVIRAILETLKVAMRGILRRERS